MTKNEHGIILPFEAADAITVANLNEHRIYLQSELDDHFANDSWMHPEDITNNRELIYCLDKIIHHFGG
jgi:hypothetical protein